MNLFEVINFGVTYRCEVYKILYILKNIKKYNKNII